MAGNVTTYNAMDCTVTVGSMTITQLGEDMVTFEKEEAFFETAVGAQGDVVRSVVNNPIYTLTLTVQATCPQKKELLRIATTGAITSVSVENAAMGERFGGSKASIAEFPSISRGSEAEDLEFTFTVFDGYFTNI